MRLCSPNQGSGCPGACSSSLAYQAVARSSKCTSTLKLFTAYPVFWTDLFCGSLATFDAVHWIAYISLRAWVNNSNFLSVAVRCCISMKCKTLRYTDAKFCAIYSVLLKMICQAFCLSRCSATQGYSCTATVTREPWHGSKPGPWYEFWPWHHDATSTEVRILRTRRSSENYACVTEQETREKMRRLYLDHTDIDILTYCTLYTPTRKEK